MVTVLVIPFQVLDVSLVIDFQAFWINLEIVFKTLPIGFDSFCHALIMAPTRITNGAKTAVPIPLAKVTNVFFKPLNTLTIGLVIVDQTLEIPRPILEKVFSTDLPKLLASLDMERLMELKFLPIAPPPLAPNMPPAVEPIKLPMPAPTAVPAPGKISDPIAPPIKDPAAPPAAVPPAAPTARPIFSLRLRLFIPINSVPPAIKAPATGIREAVRRIIPASADLTAVLPATLEIDPSAASATASAPRLTPKVLSNNQLAPLAVLAPAAPI